MTSSPSSFHSVHVQKVLFLVLMLSTTTHLIVTASATTTSTALRSIGGKETDRLSLLAFKKKITYDPQGVVNSWNDSSHFCEWDGVTCGRRHKRVVSINVRSRDLAGTLSSFVGNLSFLRALLLYKNIFKGEIPPELGRLIRLKQLGLDNNSFEGEIPATISHCSELTKLAASSNNLIGNIPKEFSSLSKLTHLWLHDNQLTGGITSFIVNLTSLESLSIAENLLGGSIPDALGQMRNLRQLGLGDNSLSEYGLGSEISTNGDVYSYGICLLEMMTGKRPTDRVFHEGCNLHDVARMAIPDNVIEIMDQMLLNCIEEEMAATEKNTRQNQNKANKMKDCLVSVVKIGVACSVESPEERMKISVVVHELQSVKNKLLQH